MEQNLGLAINRNYLGDLNQQAIGNIQNYCPWCYSYQCQCFYKRPQQIPVPHVDLSHFFREVIVAEDKGLKAIKIVKKLMEKGIVKPDVTVKDFVDLLDSLIQEI